MPMRSAVRAWARSWVVVPAQIPTSGRASAERKAAAPDRAPRTRDQDLYRGIGLSDREPGIRVQATAGSAARSLLLSLLRQHAHAAVPCEAAIAAGTATRTRGRGA